MNTNISIKVQYNNKTKMLGGRNYDTVQDLLDTIRAGYKALANKNFTVKYADEDGDWFFIQDQNDLSVLKEFIESKKGKKVKLFVVEDNTEDMDVEFIKQTEDDLLVEGIKDALEAAKIENEDSSDEDKQEDADKADLKDFKIADAINEVELLLNSDEGKVKPKDLVHAIKKAAEGTKAEVHIKRLFKKMWRRMKSQGPHDRHGHHGPHGPHGFRKMMKHCFGGKPDHKKFYGKKCKGWRKGDRGQSSSPEGFFPEHPMPHFETSDFPHEGLMAGHPHMMPPMGPGFFGPDFHGPRRHKGGPKHVMKFFKKFIKAYRDKSSSDSSSSEERQERKEKRKQNKQEHMKKRPIVSQKPVEALTGKAGEAITTNITIENGSPWPFWLTSVQKIGGDEDIKFEKIAQETKVKGKESHEIELSITLPEKEGDYSAKFGFFNKKGIQSGEELELNFKVISE